MIPEYQVRPVRAFSPYRNWILRGLNRTLIGGNDSSELGPCGLSAHCALLELDRKGWARVGFLPGGVSDPEREMNRTLIGSNDNSEVGPCGLYSHCA